MKFCKRVLSALNLDDVEFSPVFTRLITQNFIFSWSNYINRLATQTYRPTLRPYHTFSRILQTFSHVSHIKFSYTLQQTGVLFWSELGCMCTPCSRQDGLLRPRGATPEPPWRSDPRGVTGRTVVAIGTNKGSHLIMTSTLHGQAQSSGDEANVSVRRAGKMGRLNQLNVWSSVITTCFNMFCIRKVCI